MIERELEEKGMIERELEEMAGSIGLHRSMKFSCNMQRNLKILKIPIC